MNLSPHFTVAEMTESRTAKANGHVIQIGKKHLDNLRHLCETVLEPLRAIVGPLIITSGYRDKKLNDLVGGVPTSKHCTGQAVDFRPARCSYVEAGKALEDSEIAFDQLIYYHDEARLHVGLRDGTQRRMVLHKGKR